MRVTIVTPLYPPDLGRLARYTKTLAATLRATHDVHIVTYSEIPEHIEGVSMSSVSKRLPLPLRLAIFTRELWRASRTSDLLYVAEGASVGIPSVCVGRLRGIPVVRFFLDDEARQRAERALYVGIPEETFVSTKQLPLKIRVIQWLQGWVFRHVSRIVVPSRYTQQLLERTYRIPSERFLVVPTPEESAPSLPFSATRNPLQVCLHTPLTPSSGVDHLLEALVAVRATLPGVRCVIAHTGGPLLEHFKQKVKELGLAECVSFVGHPSRAEFWHTLQSSAVFLSLPTVADRADEIYAAYETATAVIASRIACYTEAVESEVSGILVNPEQTSEITNALLRVLQDPALHARLTSGGTDILRTRGGWDEHIARIFSSV